MTRLYTPAEVAERYKVKLDTVWAWIRKGKLRAARVGGKCYRISEEWLTEFEKNAAQDGEGVSRTRDATTSENNNPDQTA